MVHLFVCIFPLYSGVLALMGPPTSASAGPPVGLVSKKTNDSDEDSDDDDKYDSDEPKPTVKAKTAVAQAEVQSFIKLQLDFLRI